MRGRGRPRPGWNAAVIADAGETGRRARVRSRSTSRARCAIEPHRTLRQIFGRTTPSARLPINIYLNYAKLGRPARGTANLQHRPHRRRRARVEEVDRHRNATAPSFVAPSTRRWRPDGRGVRRLRRPLSRRAAQRHPVRPHPVDLAGRAIAEAVARAGVPGDAVDDVILGCVGQLGAQAFNIARTAALSAGLPEAVPGTTVDRPVRVVPTGRALRLAGDPVRRSGHRRRRWRRDHEPHAVGRRATVGEAAGLVIRGAARPGASATATWRSVSSRGRVDRPPLGHRSRATWMVRGRESSARHRGDRRRAVRRPDPRVDGREH